MFNSPSTFELDFIEGTTSRLTYRGEQTASLKRMTSEEARTIYFALSHYRDQIVKDIASYDNMYEAMRPYDDHHKIHNEFDPWCETCCEREELRKTLHRKEANRDEDLMFLGEILHKTGAILFEMGQNNTKEFQNWLGV